MNKKKIISAMLTVAMLASSAVSALAAEVGESLKVGDYTESAAETQKLIDSRPDIQRPMENLNRGAVAVRMDGYTYISWRWLGTESADTRYNIYRSLTEMSSYGQKINKRTSKCNNFTDLFIASDDTQYFIVPVVNGEEQWDKVGAVQLWDNNYMDIPIQKPENNKVNGEEYSYTPVTRLSVTLTVTANMNRIEVGPVKRKRRRTGRFYGVNVFLTRTSLTVHVYGV